VLQQTLHAQNRLDVPENYFGLNAGVTGSMINFNPTVSQSYLLGQNFGFSYKHIANKYTGLQVELNYSQRGWKETNDVYARKLNYIELPFMTHFHFGRSFKLFFNVGPKFSYLLSESLVFDNTDASTAHQHVNTVKNKFDYGFCGGPGCLFKIKKQLFLLDIRANYSVSDLFSNSQSYYFSMSNNINLSVNIGWQMKVN
jgi:hypothetical protein